MSRLKQYELVRVARLVHPPEHYDGSRFNKRPPAVGDTGYIVEILRTAGLPDGYMVESSDPSDGTTIWVEDFLEEELEPDTSVATLPRAAAAERQDRWGGHWHMRAFEIPPGCELVGGERGPVFRGPADAILRLADALRILRTAPTGYFVELPGVVLVVASFPRSKPSPDTVRLPRDAWNILASKFAEVAVGREESPFYFGDCGYLSAPPSPDLGVELVGEPHPEFRVRLG